MSWKCGSGNSRPRTARRGCNRTSTWSTFLGSGRLPPPPERQASPSTPPRLGSSTTCLASRAGSRWPASRSTTDLRRRPCGAPATRKPPVTLLIELLRAYIPEEFSRNGHKCDTSKSDEILRRFREDARREQAAGYPRLRKLAEGATNAPSNDDHHTEDVRLEDSPPLDVGDMPRQENPGHDRHTGGSRYPEAVPPRSSGPSQARIVTPSPDPHERPHHDDGNPPLDPEEPSHPTLSPTLGDSHNSNLSPAEGEIQRGGSSRAERRERLRQQRKAEKKNTFPVVRF